MEDILGRAMEKANPSALQEILSKEGEEEQEVPPCPKRQKTQLLGHQVQQNPQHRSNDNNHGKTSMEKNRYQGWTVPNHNYNLERVALGDLTPKSFYRDYVRQRRPVVIVAAADVGVGGVLEEQSSSINSSSSNELNLLLQGLAQWKSNDYLKAKAGKETVVVEKRSNQQDSFGRGNEVSLQFKDFLDLISSGDDMHYLTTQDVEANEDGRPDLMAPLMKKLQDDFPLRPKLTGNLVPQNINLWMGNNRSGVSSGLHHDYHDNLYLVLRGRKRFRLYSPADTEKMYTRGTLLQVHANGRINYEGEATTAHGADLKSDAAARASRDKERAEIMLAEAERDVTRGVKGAQQRLEQAEEAMDTALEALLDAEADDDEDDFEGEDDNDDDEDSNDDDDDEAEEDGPAVALFGIESKQNEPDEEDEKPSARRLVDKTVKNPNNFSRVAPALLENPKQLKESFPQMLEAKAAFCELREGDCLYLPASWFHEVKSFGCDGGHMALNYWFHPPDATDDYDRPYATDFWPNDFRQRFESNGSLHE